MAAFNGMNAARCERQDSTTLNCELNSKLAIGSYDITLVLDGAPSQGNSVTLLVVNVDVGGTVSPATTMSSMTIDNVEPTSSEQSTQSSIAVTSLLTIAQMEPSPDQTTLAIAVGALAAVILFGVVAFVFYIRWSKRSENVDDTELVAARKQPTQSVDTESDEMSAKESNRSSHYARLPSSYPIEPAAEAIYTDIESIERKYELQSGRVNSSSTSKDTQSMEKVPPSYDDVNL